MASHVTMGGDGTLFVGEDKTCQLEVLDADGIPVDITGWNIRLFVLSTGSQVLIDKTASVSGVYSVTPLINTQRAVVTLTDADTSIEDGTHRHSWKRTDGGSETILAYGDFVIERTTQT